jgi:cardiolipin synthase
MLNNIKKCIPNILTTIRLIIALGLLSMINNTLLINNPLLILPIYIIGTGTDLLDGYLARKWNVQSKYGKRTDPIADKLLNITSLFIAIKTMGIKLLYFPLAMEGVIGLANSIGTIINKKDSGIDQMGRLKTGLLCATIISLFGSIKFPQLSNIFYPLLGLTLTSQGITVHNYYHRYQNIKKQQSKTIKNMIVNNAVERHNKNDKKIVEYQKLRDILITIKDKKINNEIEKIENKEPKLLKKEIITKGDAIK